ncbi:MAG: hypothetical protein SWH78_05390 [Thermodesulfobacteriota bacterium]|nr:hypothetical protein [Thermodesulfobacteriota bacterium]
MECKDILAFAIERASAINTYWNIFIAVATAVVGVMASGKAFTNSRTLKFFLSGAFTVFAYSNLSAIIRLGTLREALLDMLPNDFSNREAIVGSLSPAEWWQYTGFHLLLDVAVLAAIWLVPWPKSDDST